MVQVGAYWRLRTDSIWAVVEANTRDVDDPAGPSRAINCWLPCCMPDPKTATKRVRIASQPRPGWKGFEQFGVASANHDIIGLQCRLKPINNVSHITPPFFLSVFSACTHPNIVFIGSPFLVGEVS